MRLSPTWFHLFPLHLARGPWGAVQQFIATQTKTPLRLPCPQPDAHIMPYPQAGNDLTSHPVWVSFQLLTVASVGCHSHNDHQWNTVYISTESAENRCESVTTSLVAHCTFAQSMNYIPLSGNIRHMTNLGHCKQKFKKVDTSWHGNGMPHLCCDASQCEISHSTL